jgi:hypothetical protein
MFKKLWNTSRRSLTNGYDAGHLLSVASWCTALDGRVGPNRYGVGCDASHLLSVARLCTALSFTSMTILITQERNW